MFAYSLYSSEAQAYLNETVLLVGMKSNSRAAASWVMLLMRPLRAGSPAVWWSQLTPSDWFGPMTLRTQPELRMTPLAKPMGPGSSTLPLAEWKLPNATGAPVTLTLVMDTPC